MKNITKIRTLSATINVIALLAGGANAALVLEFNQVGSNIELSYSGSVDLQIRNDNFGGDGVKFSASDSIILGFGGVDIRSFSPMVVAESYGGVDLYRGVFARPAVGLTTVALSSGSGWLGVVNGSVQISSLDGLLIADNNMPDMTSVSSESGGLLENVRYTISGTYESHSLDQHPQDTLIDLWRVIGTTGTDNLIQFRVNSVPEPSTALLLGLGSLGLTFRRSRNAL